MIKEKKEFTLDDPRCYNNIIIRYFNGIEFSDDIFKIIRNMSYEPNIKMFYAIPMIIFVLEQYIRKLVQN